MNIDQILVSLFPRGYTATVKDMVIVGEATSGVGPVTVLGTTDSAAIDHRIALALARLVIHTMEQHPGHPIVFFVDTSGQALSRHQELLGLNGSLAHLAQCVDLARRRGHPILSLVTANAVSGGFLSFGLVADRVYALADAQVRVMDLKAMARVTKIDHERLVGLAASSPIFAPGAQSYQRMGAIEAIWDHPDAASLDAALADLAKADRGVDGRMDSGHQRGGRTLALRTATTVAESALAA